MQKKLLCFGAGFSGLYTLQYAKSQGFDVIGTVRCATKAHTLSIQTGLSIVPFDTVDVAHIAPTHILHTIPPMAHDISHCTDAVYDMYAHSIRGLRELHWFGYFSTTGVYGHTHGDWVDETSPVNPSGIRGKRRVYMEKKWLDMLACTHIFRLPGIYGAGRSALDRVQAPNARIIEKSNQVFGRIHVADIVQTAVASMHRPHPHGIYNVVDDFPCDGGQVLRYACDLLGIQPPPVVPFERAMLSDMGQSFYDDCRRVKNDKIKTELGIILQHPDYKSGLNAIFTKKHTENAC